MAIKTETNQEFQKVVWQYYSESARHTLPWRKTSDPYKILVSEIMLQQTQVPRVLSKYREFIQLFPSFNILAQALLSSVLIAWQGLGYNRRAKALWECAKVVTQKYNGVLPQDRHELVLLPGIGPYTAGAIRAFAFNTPDIFIETNIRTVFIHHFFEDKSQIHDKEIISLIEATLDTKRVKEWYWALMDYGSFLKSQGVKLNVRSAHYTKQSKFEGSDRQIRGAILRVLSSKSSTKQELYKSLKLKFEKARFETQLQKLFKENMIDFVNKKWQLKG